MKEEKIKSVVEVFICNKEDGCGNLGAKELTDKLKKWAKEETHKQVRVFRSGCLGECDHGIAMACFPEKKMLLKVKLDDFEELKQGLEEALQKKLKLK